MVIYFFFVKKSETNKRTQHRWIIIIAAMTGWFRGEPKTSGHVAGVTRGYLRKKKNRCNEQNA